MKKKLLCALLLCFALILLSACASPTAVKVGGNKVDASEFAYYLNYNRLNLDARNWGTLVLNETQLLEQARAKSLEQIVTAEIVRIKCAELGLKLTKEMKTEIEEDKAELVDSFGGLAGYLDYLNENALTDRLYIKLQENSCYYSMLHEHVAADPANGVYTDQELRQYFSWSFGRIKYIRFSAIDEQGAQLTDDQLAALKQKAEDVYLSIKSGSVSFDHALAQNNDDNYMSANPTGLIVNIAEGTTNAYIKDAFTLENGEITGVLTYPEGYYIVQRLAVDAGYFDENREQIAHMAADWAFNNLIEKTKGQLNISQSSVCNKINFSNLKDYVK